MKRTTQKILGMAAGGVLFSGAFLSSASGNTYTWQTTGIGNSQDWSTAANWLGLPAGVPGSGDVAFFSTNVPPSNTISVNSPVSVGAILDQLTSTLTIGGGSTMTLFGQTLGVPQLGVTTSFNNVVLATGNASSGANKLTVANGLALENSQNVMVGAEGTAGLGTSNQSITISGGISNGTATPASLTLFGGGTANNYGASFAFTGANSYSGNLTLGNTSGTQGATGSFTPTSFPNTVGDITVNEQSQLLLTTTGSYGLSTQTLTLNGGGVGPGDSSGSSGALRNGSGTQVVFNPAFIVGTNTTGTHASGFVVITPAAAAGTVTLTGAISGSGSIQKQGAGMLVFADSSNTWTGGVQVGHGSIETTATASLGTGDLSLAASQTSNTAVAILNNPTQSIRNLFSTYAGESGSDTSVVDLFGTTLTVNATANHIFGYGPDVGLTSTISDTVTAHGSLIYNGSHGATLSLTGPNNYQGGTTVTGGTLNLANVSSGSATGTGNVEVKSGGELSSGGGVPQFEGSSTLATSGTLSGSLIVDSGGIVSPGGDGLVGSLSIGSLTAHNGSIFDFDLAGGTSATADQINSGGAFTLDNGGTETVNVAGSKLAFGTYTLATYGSLANAGTAFTLGSTPAGVHRSYSLTTNANSLVLNVLDTGSEYYWSVNGTNPTTDGGGTWQVGSNNFFSTNPNTSPSPYSNSTNFPVIIGNGGNGGTIQVTGAVTVGGGLIFSQVNTPYTIVGSNTITLTGGIVGAASASISAPIALTGSENIQAAVGTTLSVTGGISDGGHSYSLTVGGDTGTVVLGGSNSYSGGTVINSGTLQTATGSLPTAGGVNINGSANVLAFNQSTNGTYSGLISGNGSVLVNSASGTTVTFGDASNSYSGATELQSGVLSINAPGGINSGAGGISLQGGTLQFTAPMSFGTGTEILNTASGTSMIDTDGNNVTLGFDLSGANGNLTKIGGGTLTFNNLQPTRQIGVLSVLGGTLSLNSAVTLSFAAPSTSGGFTGDLVLGTGIAIDLQGGDINGGGTVWMTTDGDSITSQNLTSEIDNTISLNPTGQASFTADFGASSTNTLTIAGSITGAGDVDFTSGKGVVILEGQSTYDGPSGGVAATTIDNGAGGEVQLDVNNALPTTTNVHVTSSGVLDVFGVTQTIGSLDSGAPGTGAIVTNNSNNNALLVINGTKTTNFAGFIEDNFTAVAAPGGMLGLELGSSYTGTLTLDYTANNAYSGGTILDGGTLLLGTQGDGLLGNFGFEIAGIVSPTGTPFGGVTFGGGTLELSSNWNTSRALTVNPGTSTISEATPGQSVSINAPSINWNGGTLALTNTGASTLSQNGGTISVTPGSTLSIAAGSSLAINGTTDPFTDHTNSANHVAIMNNGSLSIAGVNSSSIAGITGNGALTVGNGSSFTTLHLAQNSGGSTVGSLAIMANAALDIGNNHLIINYGTGTDPITSIQALLTSGYNSGAWNGRGINSSAAAANSASYGLGYADSADAGNPAGLASGTIEVAYTLLGDADLNLVVNGIDFGILAANFNKGVTRWDQGNFDYNDVVNGIDFGLLAANFNKGASGADAGATAGDWAALQQFAAANGLLADVPEPTSIGLLAVGAAGLLARRRRNSASIN